jgi:cytoskeletal protein RodZ
VHRGRRRRKEKDGEKKEREGKKSVLKNPEWISKRRQAMQQSVMRGACWRTALFLALTALLITIAVSAHAQTNENFKLTAGDAAAGDKLGRSVSISGDRMVAGAPFDDDAGADSDSAYVLRLDGGAWVQEDKLTVDDAAEGDRFGSSVS